MGRKSKLTDKQWISIRDRVIAGESYAALAREFKVASSTLREKISVQAEIIKSVANQIVETNKAVSKLDFAARNSAFSLATEMSATTEHLASAARMNAATAHRMAGIANALNSKVSDTDPLADPESRDALVGINSLVALSNKASELGISLIRATQDQLVKNKIGDNVLTIEGGLPDA